MADSMRDPAAAGASGARPRVLVARAVFPEVVQRLRAHFEVDDNPADRVYSRAELIERLRGKAGALTTGSERIDAEVLDANPQLRVVANMAVGYNNFDIPACTARSCGWASSTSASMRSLPVVRAPALPRSRSMSSARE